MPGHDLNPVRILLIDDDVLSRELLTLLLIGEGYVVEGVDSGDAGLEYLRQSPGDLPTLILTDLQMPGLTGSELAQKIRTVCTSQGVTQPLLLGMSASQPDDVTRRSFDEFLLKPFTMRDFAVALMTGTTKHEAANGSSLLPSAVLNEEIYHQLAESIPREQLHQLYALCISDVEARVGRMRTAAARGDDDLYRREAHSIKGSSGMVGAIELHALSADMEAQGLTAANHVASLNEMLPLCERLKVILIAR
jgi:CheY-like chemotaxis protein